MKENATNITIRINTAVITLKYLKAILKILEEIFWVFLHVFQRFLQHGCN